LVPIYRVFRQEKAVVKCRSLQTKSGESFFSLARLGDETASVQSQIKVGVFHLGYR